MKAPSSRCRSSLPLRGLGCGVVPRDSSGSEQTWKKQLVLEVEETIIWTEVGGVAMESQTRRHHATAWF